MSSDIDYNDADYGDEVDIDSMTDEEFSAYLDKKYERNKPAPAEPPPPAPSAPQPTQVSVPTSTERKLAELRDQISNLDQQIQQVGGPAVELQAQRLAISEKAERLSDAITYGFDGKPDEDLTTMHEDAVLELEAVQKTISALPAESMRTEADRVRLTRAERERDALIAKGGALGREQALRRDLKDFARVRAESIDARTLKAVQAERAKALNDRLAKIRSEPDHQPWEFQAAAAEVNAVPITAKNLESKRKEIESQFDNEIADGIRRDRIRRVGGDPDGEAHWRGFDVAR